MGRKLILPGDPKFTETVGSLSLRPVSSSSDHRFGDKLLSGRRYKVFKTEGQVRDSLDPAVCFFADGAINFLAKDFGKTSVTLETDCKSGSFTDRDHIEKNQNGKVSAMYDPYGSDAAQWIKLAPSNIYEWFCQKVLLILG